MLILMENGYVSVNGSEQGHDTDNVTYKVPRCSVSFSFFVLPPYSAPS
jgi:hypothetical protein